MKKIKITLLLLSLSGISLLAQKAELKYKLQNKETYRISYNSVETTSQSMQGMSQTSETKTNMVISVIPVTSTPEYFIAQVKFDSLKIINSMPPMTIDSKNEGDINSTDPVMAITAVINRLCRSDMVIKLDYSGKVLEFMNFDAVSQNVLQGIDQLTGQNKMIVEMQTKNLVSTEMLTGMIESCMYYLPGKEVKAGDNWENMITMSSGGLGMIISTNFKLENLEKDVAIIKGKSILKPSSDEPVNMNGAMITSQMQGMGELTYQVDVASGLIISGKYEYQRSGNLLINAQGNSMEIPVESISEVTITGL